MKNLFITSSCFLFFNYFSYAQWSADPAINTPVCTSQNNQIDLRMTEDGKGGAFIAWKDYRNSSSSSPDIFIQRMNAAGYALWTNNGVALCTNYYDQSTPAIVSDMAGGVIVAWSDWRSGIERDIYAQRIDSNGTVLWTTDGVIVTNKWEREHNEKIISDGVGGAVIVWEQQSYTTYQWDIWAQRINSSGTIMWASGGVAVCTVNVNRLNPKVQSDKKGGAIIIWQDLRNIYDYDIYAQRINSSGTLLWGGSGIGICTASNTQLNPKIDPDSILGGAYIAWVDKRNGSDYDIYAQRVDSNGNNLWTANGVAVCTALNNQSAVDIVSNTSTGGVILTWKDKRNGDYDIYAQKLNPSGTSLWIVDGVILCTTNYDQINPNIISDGGEGAIVVWQDSSAGNWNVYSQKINNNGITQWLNNGIPISVASGTQGSPKNISDGVGGSIYAWQDKRSGTNDIYAHHIADTVNSTSIYENNFFNDVTISPNPFTTLATIQITNQHKYTEYEFVMYDVFGREIIKSKSTNHKLKIERGNLQSGVYFYKTHSYDGKNLYSTGKLIITD